MTIIGQLFVQDELVEMASKSELLDLDLEDLSTPQAFYEIWKEEDMPSEGVVDVISKTSKYGSVQEKKIGEIKFRIKHFVDDSGNGKFINYYLKSLERDSIIKYFKKDKY